MDNIVLGLLLLQSRTIYQLRARIGQGLHLMYSSSMGSIQAAVRKLLKAGYIQYEERTEKGRRKKLYSVTDRGRQHFLAWVNTPMEAGSGRDPELAKLYFMGFSQNRTEALEEYIVRLEERYRLLDGLCREAEGMELPKEQERIWFFQLASARYGRDITRFHIQWYQTLLKEMTAL